MLATAFAAIYARFLRGNLLEVMAEDYIRTARAKGLPERTVIFRHGVRSAITPIVTILGLDLGILLGGAILTESVFNIPGIGRLAFDSIQKSDLPDGAGDRHHRCLLHHRLEPGRRHPLCLPRPAREVLSLWRCSKSRTFTSTSTPMTAIVKAVDGVSYRVERGQALGIVGESGSGKSVSSLTVMGLTRFFKSAQISGSIKFDGQELLTASDEEMRRIRGNEIAMIFQDPLSSLHPFYRIGEQLVEAVQSHRDVSQGAGAATAPSRCSGWWASRSRASASTPTRTSSRAACASA